MSTDACLARIPHPDWLADGPLASLIAPFIDVLRAQRYAERTIIAYVSCVAHFSYWMKCTGLDASRINQAVVEQYLRRHLPVCDCPAPCRSSGADIGAALRHLLNLLPREHTAHTVKDPIAAELEQFGEYLTKTCGVAQATCDRRLHHVGAFLRDAFGTQIPLTSQLSSTQVDGFLTGLGRHLQPATIRVVCTCLRSYFRYRTLLGESTVALAAALPRTADWRHATLPKALSDTELDRFLNAFDCTDPVGLRDYAIARCLVDLGLRGHEVTYLSLDAIDWRSATLTISGTKSKRLQQLPLPVSTGEAIVQYLRLGRPQTASRLMFVRHRAPSDIPLGVPAIRNAMNRAFTRCGLRDRFCNTHVLRRTMATRLQRSGASVKEIADLLRHQSLDTASTYARIDLEGLRAVALPWPGRQP